MITLNDILTKLKFDKDADLGDAHHQILTLFNSVYRDDMKGMSNSDIMAILPPVAYLENVNRVEVIDNVGRSYVNWKEDNKTEISLQDNGKTLKVFISNKS